ncbi:MAG: CARDB domain-containing protein, partial [Anaerolineales bacterium]
ATGVSLTPTLTWAASSEASGYEYCLGTASGACDLVPWTSTGSNTQVTLAGDLLEGGTTYYWQVRAANAAGTTTANGGAWWSFTTLAPDLVVTGITTSPALPLQGQQVTIEITVRNQGTGPTPRSGFMVDLYVDRNPSACGVAGDYYALTGELAAGASRVVTITTNTLPAGTHSLRANVDTDCVVRESNESNNLSTAQPVYILPILGDGVYDDTAPIAYQGPWALYNSSGPYNNTLHYSTVVNSTAAFAVNGPRFRLLYTGYPNRGMVEIYVDGALYTAINQYSPSPAWQQMWDSGLLPGPAPHLVQIVHKSGTVADLDAVIVITDTTPPAAITTLAAGTGSTTGSVNLVWLSPGDDGSSGTAASYLVRYAAAPILSQSDWNAATPVTTGIPAPLPASSAQNMTVGGLIPGNTYYFSIRAVDDVGNVGGLSVSPSAVAKPIGPLDPGAYNDTAPDIYYAGAWQTYTGSGPTNNTLHYSTAIGDEALFHINGNRFSLTYTAHTNRGQAEIYVDGALYATLNQYNSTLAWQRTWTSGILPGAAPHTIRIVHKTGTYIDLDAVTVHAP